MKRLLPCALLALALARQPAADTIELTSGDTLTDVTVLEETLAEVSFERAGTRAAVQADLVHAVRFQRLPDALDEARSAYAEGDLQGALELLDRFVAESDGRPATRARWAPAYAAWQALEVRRELADAAGVIDSARLLRERFPESRYVPGALLAQADFERRSGSAAAAEATLLALTDLARERGLERWELAARLARLRAADRPGEEQRELLANLAVAAGEHPTVQSEARVAQAETYLAEAATAPPAEAERLRAAARPLLEQVLAEPCPGGRALAGASTGLAEILFHAGAAKQDAELLRQAVLHALRVAVSERQESEYLPRALFLAMRGFDLLGERARQADMLAELERLFPGSPWTTEAHEPR